MATSTLNQFHTQAYTNEGGKNPNKIIYGPDGFPAGENTVVDDDGYAVIDEGRIHHGVELTGEGAFHQEGWFHAESNRREQEQLAAQHLQALRECVAQRTQQGLCADGKWINDPDQFPLPPTLALGTVMDRGVVPFPPNDGQFFATGAYDASNTLLRETVQPNYFQDESGGSTWARLSFFGSESGCRLFDDVSSKRTNYGRIYQGALDNGYLVEALQAISLRPALARSLFYCWDTPMAIFIVRLFKNGVWMRVEVDDFVPIRSLPTSAGMPGDSKPICCRSEFFPHVLWPSLVEKAYAKIHTVRTADGFGDKGGWEAIGGGGRVEDALADLTGGVAGRFRTKNVAPDRLFVYLHELQRDCLFVCRPNDEACTMNRVLLNPYFPYAVNRATVFEGRTYVQVFCGAPALSDGGLQDTGIPWALITCEEYCELGETSARGFFWLTAEDFQYYFDTIFECRLTSSGDVSIPHMPPPRIPSNLSMSSVFSPRSPKLPDLIEKSDKASMMHLGPDGLTLPFFEWVFANPGDVKRGNEPEFSIRVPEFAVPCEVYAAVDQVDLRMHLGTEKYKDPCAILLKVYESVEGAKYYSKDLVCKSNWLPIRSSSVAFQVTRGGEFKITAELGNGVETANKLIFRCYVNQPGVQVNAMTMWARHLLVWPRTPPKAKKLSFVGTGPQESYSPYDPDPFDPFYDSMRTPAMDNKGCSVM